MHHFLEFRTGGQFFQAAPVLWTLGLGQLGANGFQVQLALLSRTNFLAMFVLIKFFHLQATDFLART